MDAPQIHFELFVRRRVDAPWTLELACEDRARAFETAETLLEDGDAAAVKLVKEVLDPVTREFKSVTLLTQGAVESRRRTPVQAVATAPHCVSPTDLYTGHARERIGRLLEGWLKRAGVTTFELLHRPDLAERLDASGRELQHAVQKVAIPEAQARGATTHEMIRLFQGLAERTLARLVKDGRDGRFPDVSAGRYAAAAEALADEPDGAYRLGGGVAADMADARGWGCKVDRLLDLADAAPTVGRARALALGVVEQPLAEILASRAGLSDLVGLELDLGGGLLALARLAAEAEMAALVAADAQAARLVPPLTGAAARLARRLEGEAFETVRTALTKRVLAEVTSPRRLRPGDPEAEIAVLRVLAMALTATAGRLLSNEEVQDAFVQRSRALVAADFVELYLAGRETALSSAQALVRLAENVVGAANKRTAGRWIVATVGALRFETELRRGPDGAPAKLAALAALQRSVRAAGLPDAEADAVCGKIGEVGGLVEGDVKLTGLIARSDAPLAQRLTLLLRLATGEAAPSGPAADRARVETLKLLRADSARAELTASPAPALDRMRALLHEAGLAA